MQHVRTARRSVLLALTLLSACAASEPSSDSGTGQVSNGVIGNYLAGRYALSEGDLQTAANDLLKAVAESPGDPELTLQAFIASLDAGRPEAVRLARQLPDSQVAQLVLADVDIKAGRWEAAEQRFHALPRQGLTQLLQPLLVAWAQQGDGRTDTALSTLRPYVENPRFRTIFALHAAMIADLGDRKDEAASCIGPPRPIWRSPISAWRRSWRAGRRVPPSRRTRSASSRRCLRSRRTWRSSCRG